MVQNRKKVKVNPFTLFLGCLYSKSIFSRILESGYSPVIYLNLVIRLGYTWIWLFAWDIPESGYSPGYTWIWLFARDWFVFGPKYMVIRPGEYIWLFARANIKSYSPFFQSPFFRELYVQWSSNAAKNAFKGLKKLFRTILKDLK